MQGRIQTVQHLIHKGCRRFGLENMFAQPLISTATVATSRRNTARPMQLGATIVMAGFIPNDWMFIDCAVPQ